MERWGRLMWRIGAGVWLGSMFFLFFVIAPNVFRVLPEAMAGQLVDAIFPIYYRIGLVFGGLLLLGAAVSVGTQRVRARWVLVAAGVVNFLLVWWADRILAHMTRLASTRALFHALHQRSLIIGAASFVVILFAVVFEALAVD